MPAKSTRVQLLWHAGGELGTAMFLVAGGTMTSCDGVVSQAVPAATSQVLRRRMRSRLKT